MIREAARIPVLKRKGRGKWKEGSGNNKNHTKRKAENIKTT